MRRLLLQATDGDGWASMKYVIVIPDGAADEPQASLNGATPLQAANTPAMDRVAAEGIVGTAFNVPEPFVPGSDVATLSLLGYDPHLYYTGRAPLEAAAQGIELGPHDWAVRCNLVTIENGRMADFSAGHISTDEAHQLVETLNRALGSDRLQFVPGVSYRNLLILRGHPDHPVPLTDDTHTTPPHEIPDRPVAEYLPSGPGAGVLLGLMERSKQLFAEHPVNQRRRSEGKRPATQIWLWGQGRRPALPSFAERFGVQGVMITAVDLLRGIAALIGWDRIEVPGATGYLDTDFAAKGQAACDALHEYDVVCVHIEAPDEASHEGRLDAKIKAIEEIDKHIVAPLWEEVQGHEKWRLLISPDHPTPIRTKTHGRGYVPWAAAGSGIRGCGLKYHESDASGSTFRFDRGHELMPFFIKEPSIG